MSEWGFENENEGQGNDNPTGPKALRDYAAELKRQNEELSAKLTSFLEDQQKQKMATVFESLGVPGAQSVYKGEADPEKAKAWVESMRSVFGGQPPAAEPQQQATEPKLPPSMQAQYERLSQAGSDGQPLGNVEAAQAAVNDANDPQALINAFKQMNF